MERYKRGREKAEEKKRRQGKARAKDEIRRK
jgi:hypothetical protein